MKIEDYKFGSITIDGKNYRQDIMVNKGKIELRDKKGTENYSGHAPLLITENIPWDCEILIVGTGASSVMEVDMKVIKESRKRDIKLVMLSTPAAIEAYNLADQAKTNSVFHLTC